MYKNLYFDRDKVIILQTNTTLCFFIIHKIFEIFLSINILNSLLSRSIFQCEAFFNVKFFVLNKSEKMYIDITYNLQKNNLIKFVYIYKLCEIIYDFVLCLLKYANYQSFDLGRKYGFWEEKNEFKLSTDSIIL